jgi:hypothetical protein
MKKENVRPAKRKRREAAPGPMVFGQVVADPVRTTADNSAKV